MNRTQWPLLNRARVHGVISEEEQVANPDRIDPNTFIPINIQYACNTLPPIEKARSHSDLHKQYFLETGLRSPFPYIWFEWMTGKDREQIDNYAVLVTTPHEENKTQPKDGLTLFMGWDIVSHRSQLKRKFVPIFYAFKTTYEMFTLSDMDDVLDNLRFGATPLVQNVVDSGKMEEKDEMAGLARVNTMTQIVFWSWLLLQCKNVTTIESQPSYRNNRRQKAPSRVIHKELCVEVPPGGKRRQSVSEGGETVGTAFHIRMGHFADYTKGKGLFGKYHGKYWIPSTTVGDVDYGTVIKSYRLEG